MLLVQGGGGGGMACLGPFQQYGSWVGANLVMATQGDCLLSFVRINNLIIVKS